MERKTRYVCAGLLMCLSISFTGCKESRDDYGMEEKESAQTENSVKDISTDSVKRGIEQFADEGKWCEIWELQDDDGNEFFQDIDAKIYLPDTKGMSVVEVKEPNFDDAYKKRLVKNFMEQGTYDEKADTYTGTYDGSVYELFFWEGELGDHPRKDEKYVRFNKQTNFLKKDDNADDEGFITCCYGKEIRFRPYDLYEFCPDEVKNVEDLYYKALENETTENKCKISMEDARKIAENFAKDLNLEYPVYAYSRPLGWWKGFGKSLGDERLDYVADGYVFTFDAGVDTVSFPTCQTQEMFFMFTSQKQGEEPRYSMKARMEICVNDKGIVGVRAENPIETVGISENVELLPMESIQKILKDQICKSGNHGFRRLDLIYFRLRDQEHDGYYSYVPVWRLADVHLEDGAWNLTEYENQILINAIDGSVIDFFHEA